MYCDMMVFTGFGGTSLLVSCGINSDATQSRDCRSAKESNDNRAFKMDSGRFY